MKVAVLGASGKLGQQLVASCVARGYEVTAAVRSPDLYCLDLDMAMKPLVRAVKLDVMDAKALDAIMEDQDAVISAAGNVADGPGFVDLFDRVTTSAERVLGSQRRIWMVAGAMVLDIPHVNRISLGLPFVPTRYRPHLENWRRLERTALDWALMCPGPMFATNDQPEPHAFEMSIDSLPVAVGRWVRHSPQIGLSLMLQRQLPRLKVPLRSVADLMLANLEPGGRFGRHRVGIGWSVSKARAA